MRLGGWWRVWVLISMGYGILVLGVASTTWPQAAEINNTALIDRLIADLPDVREGPSRSANSVSGPEHQQAPNFFDRFDQLDKRPTFEVTAPDGRVFHVTGPEGSTADDALKQVQSRFDQFDPKKELHERRFHFALVALAVWLTPCVVLVGIGLALSWVYRGFKPAA